MALAHLILDPESKSLGRFVDMILDPKSLAHYIGPKSKSLGRFVDLILGPKSLAQLYIKYIKYSGDLLT